MASKLRLRHKHESQICIHSLRHLLDLILVLGALFSLGQGMNPTPDCPLNSYQYEVTLCDVDLVCHLDYVPAERGSTGSLGDAYEPDYSEEMDLIAAYVAGTDVDLLPILASTFMDHIERLALANFKDTIP